VYVTPPRYAAVVEPVIKIFASSIEISGYASTYIKAFLAILQVS